MVSNTEALFVTAETEVLLADQMIISWNEGDKKLNRIRSYRSTLYTQILRQHASKGKVTPH